MRHKGHFPLVKISGISGSVVNGTCFVRSSHWKIPRKSGKSEKVGPFSRLEFLIFMFHLHVSRSLYQFQVHAKEICRAPRRTGAYDPEWNNLIRNSTFAPIEISVFFPKWKAPKESSREGLAVNRRTI